MCVCVHIWKFSLSLSLFLLLIVLIHMVENKNLFAGSKPLSPIDLLKFQFEGPNSWHLIIKCGVEVGSDARLHFLTSLKGFLLYFPFNFSIIGFVCMSAWVTIGGWIGDSNHLVVVVVGCVHFNWGVKIGEDFDWKLWKSGRDWRETILSFTSTYQKKKKIGERRNNIYINRQINIKLDAGLCEFKFAEIVKVGFSDQIWLNLYWAWWECSYT